MRPLAKHVTLLLLRGYKWAISPMFPPACRYVPTCSDYAMEAVERYGALRGVWMAMGRVLRCHPLARGGHDPVVKTAFAGASSTGAARGPSAPHDRRPSDDHAPLRMTRFTGTGTI